MHETDVPIEGGPDVTLRVIIGHAVVSVHVIIPVSYDLRRDIQDVGDLQLLAVNFSGYFFDTS